MNQEAGRNNGGDATQREETMANNIFAAVTAVQDTHFDSLAAEVSALEEVQELLQGHLSRTED